MKKTTLSVGLCLISLLSNAQWSTTYPTVANNTAKDVMAQSTFAWAAASAKLCYSTQTNGSGWSAATSISAAPVIDNIGGNGSMLFAGDATNGKIYRSIDQGITWGNFYTGMTATEAYGFYTVNSNTYVGTNMGVFKSIAGGNWASSTSGISAGTTVYRFASNASVLYALTNSPSGGKIYQTTDNGTTWTVYGGTFPGSSPNTMIFNGTKIYAGAANGLYMSANAGSTWTLVSGLPAGKVTIFKSGTTLLAGAIDGIYKSSNDGATWVAISTGLPAGQAVGYIAEGDTYLYIVCNGKIYRRLTKEALKVDDVAASDLCSVYPNPSSNGEFNIVAKNKELAGIEVYNLLGAKIYSSSIGADKATIDLSKQPKGVYSYTVKTRDGVTGNGKLVVE